MWLSCLVALKIWTELNPSNRNILDLFVLLHWVRTWEIQQTTTWWYCFITIIIFPRKRDFTFHTNCLPGNLQEMTNFVFLCVFFFVFFFFCFFFFCFFFCFVFFVFFCFVLFFCGWGVWGGVGGNGNGKYKVFVCWIVYSACWVLTELVDTGTSTSERGRT